MSGGDWLDPTAVVRPCHRCGAARPCLLLPDPVAVARNPGGVGALTRAWWCRPCYLRRKDDVGSGDTGSS